MAEEIDIWRTDTNSANDSKGWAFGLEENLFIPIVIGAFVGAVVTTACLMLQLMDVVMSIAWGCLFPGLALLYVMTLRHNRPPNFDRDLFEEVLTSEDGSDRPFVQPPHPREEAVKIDELAAAAEKRRARKNR